MTNARILDLLFEGDIWIIQLAQSLKGTLNSMYGLFLEWPEGIILFTIQSFPK
jgi:hypothetical protein